MPAGAPAAAAILPGIGRRGKGRERRHQLRSPPCSGWAPRRDQGTCQWQVTRAGCPEAQAAGQTEGAAWCDGCQILMGPPGWARMCPPPEGGHIRISSTAEILGGVLRNLQRRIGVREPFSPNPGTSGRAAR